MGREVYVQDLAYALGDVSGTVHEAESSGLLVSSAEALEEAGFQTHYRSSRSGTCIDLAIRAVEPIKARLEDTAAIVYSTCIPTNGNIGSVAKFHESRDVKHLMDFPASRLQVEMGLDKAFVIGLNQQACTGMLGSLRLAQNLILAEPDVGKVLCVTADRFPDEALYEQSYNLISDGAAACIVSTEKTGFRFLACDAVTNGAMVMASDDQTVGSFFNYTHDLVKKCVEKAGLEVGDIDWVVPQNTNVKAWRILSRLLNLDFDRVFLESLADVGHVISGDNIVNLKQLDESGRLEPGDRVLLVMAGYGSNWQCVLLEKVSP